MSQYLENMEVGDFIDVRGRKTFYDWLVGWFMVFNSTFNNISVISWQSVLLVEDKGVLRENHRPATGQ
jgi:hypothetical protein